MAVFIHCQCGKNLSVTDDRARGKVRCPGCGRLTAISPPRIAAPIETPSSTSNSGSSQAEKPAVGRFANQPIGDGAVVLQNQQEKNAFRRILGVASKEEFLRRTRPEDHGATLPWFFGFLDWLPSPVRAQVPPLFLAGEWATLISLAVVIFPARWEWMEVLVRSPLCLLFFLLLGSTIAYLRVTLAAPNKSDIAFAVCCSVDLRLVVRSGLQGMWCFLAGPIIPVVVAFFFWRESGNLATVDRLILWELGTLAVSYWILVLSAVLEFDRFRDANPAAIVGLVQRVGYRVPIAALIASLTFQAHFLLVFETVQELHQASPEQRIRAWMVLASSWMGQLIWIALLSGWVGRDRPYSRRQAAWNQ